MPKWFLIEHDILGKSKNANWAKAYIQVVQYYIMTERNEEIKTPRAQKDTDGHTIYVYIFIY